MSTYLDTLRAELDEMVLDNSIEPLREVGESDRVVDEADTDLIKLYTLSIRLSEEVVEALKRGYDENDSAVQKRLIDFAQMKARRSDIVKEIFWTSIKDAYDLWDKPSVGIRKGWKITWSDDEGPAPQMIGLSVPVELIASLLGREARRKIFRQGGLTIL